MFGEKANFGGLVDVRGAPFFDCLVQEVAGEEADAALGERRRRWGSQTSTISAFPALSLTFSAARLALYLLSNDSPEEATVLPLLATSRHR